MSGSINKVILIGRVGKAPEIRTFQSGGRVATFSIATSEHWKDKDGNKKEVTQWHNISVFNDGIIKLAESYIKKGDNIYIEGQLETRKWKGQDGKDNYSTEVVLRPYKGNVVLLEGKKESTPVQQQAPEPESYPNLEEDIPF